jgi:hypothetical protein
MNRRNPWLLGCTFNCHICSISYRHSRDFLISVMAAITNSKMPRGNTSQLEPEVSAQKVGKSKQDEEQIGDQEEMFAELPVEARPPG